MDLEPSERVITVPELEKLQAAFNRMRGAVQSWSLFVPRSVAVRLLNAGVEAQIGVSRTLVSILFVDIDGFEAACKGLTPNEVLAVLSSVLGRVADTIDHHKGTLLEFIGDEVLAVYS